MVGDPISKVDYLDHYSLLIKYVVEELTFVDWENQQTRLLLEMEMSRAETQWLEYSEKNDRPPDYTFLQNEVTQFGIERVPLFNGVDGELSVDNFVHAHIEQLKLENLLENTIFDNQDLLFIESYERNKAKEYFLKRNRFVYGYEDFRISKNETMQQAAYVQLKQEFLNDPLQNDLSNKRKK